MEFGLPEQLVFDHELETVLERHRPPEREEVEDRERLRATFADDAGPEAEHVVVPVLAVDVLADRVVDPEPTRGATLPLWCSKKCRYSARASAASRRPASAFPRRSNRSLSRVALDLMALHLELHDLAEDRVPGGSGVPQTTQVRPAGCGPASGLTSLGEVGPRPESGRAPGSVQIAFSTPVLHRRDGGNPR